MFFANLAEEGGRVYAIAISTLSLDGVSIFMANSARQWRRNLVGQQQPSTERGAVYSYAATPNLHCNSMFEYNSATTGGNIHACWSRVRVTNCSDFRHKTAVFGGGIYTDNSTFEFNDSRLVVVYMLHKVF